jgi:Flp pilus assembly pilin Flp
MPNTRRQADPAAVRRILVAAEGGNHNPDQNVSSTYFDLHRWSAHMLLRLLKDDTGQGLVEYTLVAAGFAMMLVFSLSALGRTTGNEYTNVSTFLR